MKLNGFILAAGFGKRMGQYTKNTPKPLLPVSGVPLIYYSLYNLYRWKIQKIYINVHYLGENIIRMLEKYPHAEIVFSMEKEILGTAGGIRTALGGDLDQTLVILNPDTLLLPEKEDSPREITGDSLTSLLYLSPRDINSSETGFDFSPGSSVLNFSSAGKYYYIGYSLLNAQILNEIPLNEKRELGEIWREKYIPEGRVFSGRYFDCGNASLYEELMDTRIYETGDLEWNQFLSTCGL